ncbi:hydrolase Cof [Sphingomonas sp. Leaf357]|uniref:Cof-type HAD-IIB family hydrolase n=1 Tax=Sphingomonas sp. Leaf357 TaxID=1736350 RepID=UPI0006F657DD|nr:Cof-type HAD-IIB family hydrolase [Sphingomonas sp. Leaf357]KQS02121.1 hydrolase Cof [Sphingomonas sp. Leaf357]
MSVEIRLVVSDVDGTLVDGKKELTSGTIDAVGRLRTAGLGFTIVSARPRSGMMPIADRLAIDAPMGAFNGGTIFKRDGTIVCQHFIDREVVEGMFDLAEGAAVDVWVFADDRWYASTDQGVHVTHERIASNQAPIVTGDFTELYDRADKITFVSDDADLLRGLNDKARPFADRATIMQSQTYYLDVTARAANKGDGISLLAEAMGTPLSATCAIGDQANDVPMFARAGLSIAMGQGPADVRAKADKVTAGNDEDGVAQAIDTIILPSTLA